MLSFYVNLLIFLVFAFVAALSFVLAEVCLVGGPTIIKLQDVLNELQKSQLEKQADSTRSGILEVVSNLDVDMYCSVVGDASGACFFIFAACAVLVVTEPPLMCCLAATGARIRQAVSDELISEKEPKLKQFAEEAPENISSIDKKDRDIKELSDTVLALKESNRQQLEQCRMDCEVVQNRSLAYQQHAQKALAELELKYQDQVKRIQDELAKAQELAAAAQLHQSVSGDAVLSEALQPSQPQRNIGFWGVCCDPSQDDKPFE